MNNCCNDNKGGETSRRRHPLKMVAVHLGAGNTKDNSKSQEFAKMICEEIMFQHNQEYDNKKQKHIIAFDSSPECRQCSRTHHNDVDQMITAESAVLQLVQRMEDNQDLNCALGSNLNMQGQVECDAGFMSDRTRIWCGVGAVSGCRNPISLVESLHDHQNIPRPLGLVQPNMLVGSGAKQWMREHCPHLIVAESRLISSRSFSQYQRLKSRYDSEVRHLKEGVRSNSRQPIVNPPAPEPPMMARRPADFYRHPDAANDAKTGSPDCLASTSLDHGSYCMNSSTNEHSNNNSNDRGESSSSSDGIQSDDDSGMRLHHEFETVSFDTVGAVAVDCDNNFVSAISSGGLLLKYKGRVGQAAIPGAGCWSEDNIAATTTGVGEHLTTTTFAKRFHDKVQMLRLLYDLGHIKLNDPSLAISGCVEDCFDDLTSKTVLANVPKQERLAGLLAVIDFNSKNLPPRLQEGKNHLYLSYGHNTNTMCIGYMTCNDVAGYSIMSRQEHEKKIGQPLIGTITLAID